MKKSFRLLLALLLIGGFALSFSSCKDNENVSDDPNSPENIALSPDSEPARALKSFLSFTSGLDSLPDNWASNEFTVEANVGIVNDESTPYVRYIPVLNKEEAITKYNSFAAEPISKDASIASWSNEHAGSFTFKVLNQADVTATLDVNIKQLPHLTQIRFVPGSALGENASCPDPYYTFGDVIELTEGSNKSYWICARPCSRLESKSTSHWFSFNLNAADAKSPAKPNYTLYTKKKYGDYYLPTDLGDESESYEHIPNLFKVLSIINAPSRAKDFNIDQKGLGGLTATEFSETKRTAISDYWKTNRLWNKVLPKKLSETDLMMLMSNGLNVFYNGHCYKWYLLKDPGVYMATLSKTDLEATKSYISWERTKDAVDFRQYENGWYSANPVTTLPQKGVIVRYKTGYELIGGTRSSITKKTSNDEAPGESFTNKHSNIIKDIYVYKKDVQTKLEGEGQAIMGDYITNSKTNTMEICVQNSSERTEYCSYFVRLHKPSAGDTEPIGREEAALDAYSHILNAMILHSNLYKEYNEKKNQYSYYMPTFSDYYTKGLEAMYSGISSMISNGGSDMSIINFKATDQEEKVTGNLKDLTYFTLTFTFREDLSQTQILRYNVKTGKYSHKKVANSDITNKTHLCLFLVKDVNGAIDLDSSSHLSKNINNTSERKSIKDATNAFIESNQTYE